MLVDLNIQTTAPADLESRVESGGSISRVPHRAIGTMTAPVSHAILKAPFIAEEGHSEHTHDNAR